MKLIVCVKAYCGFIAALLAKSDCKCKSVSINNNHKLKHVFTDALSTANTTLCKRLYIPHTRIPDKLWRRLLWAYQ